jgi:hypothetical protein
MTKGIDMKYVKFLFCPKNKRGDQWAQPTELNYELGNKHSDKLHHYFYHRNYLGIMFSEFLEGDKRQYDKKAKFTVNEANILLLKMIEDNLKQARKDKKDMEKWIAATVTGNAMFEYRMKVVNRDIAFNLSQAKIYRKKVREIKKSPEYAWELLYR